MSRCPRREGAGCPPWTASGPPPDDDRTPVAGTCARAPVPAHKNRCVPTPRAVSCPYLSKSPEKPSVQPASKGRLSMPVYCEGVSRANGEPAAYPSDTDLPQAGFSAGSDRVLACALPGVRGQLLGPDSSHHRLECFVDRKRQQGHTMWAPGAVPVDGGPCPPCYRPPMPAAADRKLQHWHLNSNPWFGRLKPSVLTGALPRAPRRRSRARSGP